MSVTEASAPEHVTDPRPFRSVVVGFDAPEHGHDALALGEMLARSDGASLTAVSVYVYRPVYRGGDAEFERFLRSEAEDRLAPATRLARDPRPTLAVTRGHSRAEGLYRYALEHDSDLIVVGATRHGRAGRMVTRSVPETLLHDGPCAVAVAPRDYARSRPNRLRTIGVGFDGGEESRAALRSAARLARTTGARLDVVGVHERSADFTVAEGTGLFPYFEYEALARQQGEKQVVAAVSELEDVDATAITCDGRASDVLVERSRELDLLVVGSRGFGAVRRVLLGSTSSATLHHARCPVLVIPRTGGIADSTVAPADTRAGSPTT